jgi:hypothetical protein
LLVRSQVGALASIRACSAVGVDPCDRWESRGTITRKRRYHPSNVELAAAVTKMIVCRS